MFAIILLYAISAGTYIMSRWLLLYTTPILLAGLRTCIAGCLFLSYNVIIRKKYTVSPYAKPCFFIGCSSFFIGNSLKFFGLQAVSSQQAVTVALTEPLFAALFAYLVCNERLTSRQLPGFLFCLVGGYYSQTISLSVGWWGTCLLFASVMISSYGALLMRKMLLAHYDDASLIYGLSMFTAGACSCSTSFFLEYPLYNFSGMPVALCVSVLICMIAISNIYAYNLYSELVKRYSAVLISSAGLLRPCFISLYHGDMTYQMLLSGALIMCGLLMLYRQETEQQPVNAMLIH